MRKRKELLKRISVINDDGFVVCNFIYSQTEINRYKKYYYSIYRKHIENNIIFLIAIILSI